MKTFVSPQTSLGDLDARSAAALIAAASDVTLVMDSAGVIRDMSFRSDELLADLDGGESWLDRPVAATVAPDSRPKVEALLRDASTGTEARWRHINHLAADGRSVPVLYCCVELGGGRLVAFGRDLRAMSALQQRLVNAQQSMERDYSRLREMEMRYRLLFQMSSEAVLILDGAKLRVVEANPAARAMFGVEVGEMAGLGLPQLFAGDGAGLVQAHLAAVRAGAHVDQAQVRLGLTGTDGVPKVALIKASLFRQDNETLFLMRVAPLHAAEAAAAIPDVKTKLLRAVESAPDGFVVTDNDGGILTANAAFLDMAQLANEDQARGRSLDNWVGKSGLDMDLLIANLRQRGSVRFFSTSMRGEDGGSAQVEISAVSVRNGGHPSFGFAIRNVGPRLHVEAASERKLPRSVEQLTELIGRVALKDLVREATEVIERLCIEAALDLTDDNRASAAEMLGLSRQSLYVKLRRYGLGDLSSGGQE